MSKKILFKCGLRRPAIYVPCLVLTMSLLSGMAWGFDLPGLGVTIQPEAGHEDLKYAKGDPIKLDIITRNTAGIELYTERGFSKLEQHRFLSLIDPGGKKYFLGGEVSSGDAPPPFFIEDRASARLRELVPAELLAAEYNKPVAVTDLTELFPVMKTTLGWYTLEVNMPFIRFYYTREDNVLGLLGDAADTENWDGTLNSNRLQLQITLPAGVKGAYLKIHVRDQNQQPLGQVPVRVFETAAIAGLSLEDAFATATPVLSGSTDPDGLAVWNPDTCQPEDDYTAIAYYNEEYKTVIFAPGETGWADACAGEIEKQIVFGGAAEGGRFSVLALEHVWLRTDAVISSGDVAANKSNGGQILCAEPDCEEIEVYVDAGAFAADNVQILGDTIFIASGASVFDVAFNDLENHGEIRGQQITPLTLPVWTPPAFLESTPGGCNVTGPGRLRECYCQLRCHTEPDRRHLSF